MKQYNKENIPHARKLRKNMTPWERKLWYDFLQNYPIRFQRQKAIGNYIVDFYCAKARLAVELDGGGDYVPDQEKADVLRTAVLERMGLRVVRICNADVDRNFRGVCDYLDGVVQESLPQSASLTAPSSEGAKGTIFALGFFDGVHLGHQALLAECRRLAERENCRTGVVTFLGHPEALTAGKTPLLINTPDDRRRLLCRCGVDNLIELPFDRALMTMPWQDFFRLLLDKGAAGLVCGSDFRFGHRGEGSADLLRAACEEAGIPCIVVPQQMQDGIRISSTHIRSLLEAGKMEEAVRFLGHPHVLTGTVVSGRKLGRTIGIPTANLLLPEGVAVPRLGVYACVCVVDGKEYPAVTNVGSRPTVEGHQVRAESWILDFDGDLYGKTVMLEFYKFLRPERRFSSLEELHREILNNAEQTRQFFEEK